MATTLSLISAINLPDATGGPTGEGFTCTGLCRHSTVGWWVGNYGRENNLDNTITSSIVHLSEDFTTNLGEIDLTSMGEVNVQGVAMDTTSNTLWVSINNFIYFFDESGTELHAEIPPGTSGYANGICYDPVSHLMYVINTDGDFSVWDPDTRTKISDLTPNSAADSDMLLMVERKVWCSGGTNGLDGYVWEYDPILDSWAHLYTLDGATEIEGMAIVGGTLHVMNDGYYHNGNPLKNRVLSYSLPWLAPIGIPIPDWGATIGNPIDLPAPTPPSPWTSNVANVYYVESGGTNPNEGYPGNPRNSIPLPLPAGCHVFINGTYTTDHNSSYIRSNGTAIAPCWILSYDAETPATATKSWIFYDTNPIEYVIVDNINWDWSATGGKVALSDVCEYICIRTPNTTGKGVATEVEDPVNFDSGASEYNRNSFEFDGSNIVLFNATSTRGGNWLYATGDPDAQGVSVGWPNHDIWIVDCEFSYFSGCAVHLGAGSTGSTPDGGGTTRGYVGRNVAHHIAQSAFWSKRSDDCVMSQNTAYTIRRDTPSSPNSSGFGAQYGPRNLWFLCNTAYDVQSGIKIEGMSLEVGQTGTDMYFIGNLLYNIHDEIGEPDDWRTNAEEGAGTAILLRGGLSHYVINNTIHDYDAGILSNIAAENRIVEGNILTGRNDAVNGCDIHFASDEGGLNVIDKNIIEEISGACWVKSATTYTTVAALNAAKGPSNSATVPTYANAAGGDFRLDSGSNGIDDFGATAHAVYDLFETNYGLSIAVDNSGGTRPWSGDAVTGAPGGNWDIGAFEFGSATYSAPPPSELPATPTFSVSRHITPNSP